MSVRPLTLLIRHCDAQAMRVLADYLQEVNESPLPPTKTAVIRFALALASRIVTDDKAKAKKENEG